MARKNRKTALRQKRIPPVERQYKVALIAQMPEFVKYTDIIKAAYPAEAYDTLSGVRATVAKKLSREV